MSRLSQELAFNLVSKIQELQSDRYITVYTDPSGTTIHVAIFKTPSHIHVPYVVSLSTDHIYFFAIRVDPTVTLITITELVDAKYIAYSISKSQVFYFHKNKPHLLNYSIPSGTQNKNLCKQSLLNLFSFPTLTFILYDDWILQFTQFTDGYEPTIRALLHHDHVRLLHHFDFNGSLIALHCDQPEFVMNTSTIHAVNPFSYLPFDVSDNLILGFRENYQFQWICNEYPSMARVTHESLNLNINPGASQSVSYIPFLNLLPLFTEPITTTSYWWTGIGGVNAEWTSSLRAIIQQVDILNSNNTYVTITATIQFDVSCNTLEYYFDNTTSILHVSSSPTCDEWINFINQQNAQIILSDLILHENEPHHDKHHHHDKYEHHHDKYEHHHHHDKHHHDKHHHHHDKHHYDKYEHHHDKHHYDKYEHHHDKYEHHHHHHDKHHHDKHDEH